MITEQRKITTEPRKIKYVEALREALDYCLASDKRVFVIGEGVPDPKAIFGTTTGLLEKYGKNRVLDMPLSENGLTGVCIGAALTGLRPVLIHQRIDFSLLALDQVINNAAKWHYMFGGKNSVPLVIRMVIGMGWGQGAQHSQNLQALYAHIPGLKVVMPTTAYDAKGLLISSIQDNNPIIFIEHRWLHNLLDYVPEEPFTVPLGEGKIRREGNDCTLVATSYMVVEANKAADFLKNKGIGVEVIDLRTLKPLDENIIRTSIKKTGRLLAVDSGYYTGGFAGEIISRIAEKEFLSLRCAPERITLPDHPAPSSPGLAQYYYPRAKHIVEKIAVMMSRPDIIFEEDASLPLDVPDNSFTGPF